MVDAREILSDCILHVVENMHYLRSWPLAWTLKVSVICLWGAGGAGRRERERERMKTWLPARAGCSRNANVHQYPCPLFCGHTEELHFPACFAGRYGQVIKL